MYVNDYVAASVATLIVENGQLLLGKRIKNNVFEGWQCPGGYLLKGESVEMAGKRYCLQKAGLEISDITPGPYTNNLFSTQSPIKHNVTLYLLARQHQVEEQKLFVSKDISWSWYEIDKLPELLFLPLRTLLEQHDLAKLIQHQV